jgi:hypothetical protein
LLRRQLLFTLETSTEENANRAIAALKSPEGYYFFLWRQLASLKAVVDHVVTRAFIKSQFKTNMFALSDDV